MLECDEFDLSTYRAGGGSFSVVGGSDCNDGDGYVYPSATEYCDGVFNDCENVAYDIEPAPADEIDNDGDGYVECTLTTGVNWRGDTVPTGDEDCDDTRATVYPNAVRFVMVYSIIVASIIIPQRVLQQMKPMMMEDDLMASVKGGGYVRFPVVVRVVQ